MVLLDHVVDLVLKATRAGASARKGTAAGRSCHTDGMTSDPTAAAPPGAVSLLALAETTPAAL
ncbi:MAG: hypothetical protein GVY33_09610 [Alphaproteobacteria bacterium]|nr:hypothetical protein [Alphaproteobacteria bacterium]